MVGIGTIVNTVAIIIGGTAGSFAKSGLSDRFKNTIMQAIGLSVLLIGASGSLQGILKVVEGGKLDRQYIMLMIFSLVIGGLAGEILNIEDKLDRLGLWFQVRFTNKNVKTESGECIHGGTNTFAEGFVTASLIYCVGAMAIMGSLDDGLRGDPSILFAKSILDGISAIVFAATMGIGVSFSAIPVFIYQGFITLLARFIQPWLPDMVVTQMSLVGSVLIVGIGLNILEIKKIKVGNLLPSIFVPFVYYIILQWGLF